MDTFWPSFREFLALSFQSINCDSPIFIGGEIYKTQSRKGIAQDRPASLSSPSARAASAFISAICRTHLRDLLFQSFWGQERTEQVPTQREKVRNRLE
jgi:hypothetical protein